MLIKILVIHLLFLLSNAQSRRGEGNCEAKEDEPWSYTGNNGPNYWGINYPTCNGQMQSPIVIDPRRAVSDSSSRWQVSLFGYETPVSGVIENNGHAVEVRPNDRVTRGFTFGGKRYDLEQFHFHFGKENYGGSEHIIQEEQHTMELHLVHQNNRNEVVVIAILFKETQKENKNLNPITKRLNNIRYEDDEASVENINLQAILPNCLQPVFYAYDGSLTTPSCTEGVKWFVLNGDNYVSSAQMRLFRRLYATNKFQGKCPLAGNIRPVQNLNGRRVTAYYGVCLSG